jgi:hypothetical protein
MQVHGNIHAFGRPHPALAALPPRPHTQLVGDSAARRLPPRAVHDPRLGVSLHLQPEQEGRRLQDLRVPRVRAECQGRRPLEREADGARAHQAGRWR